MISILIVDWNSGDRLRSLVASIAKLYGARGGGPLDSARGRQAPALLGEGAAPGLEVLVCDNGSRDGSADDLPEAPGLRVERPGRNLGFGGALNMLSRLAKGDVLLFLNPDCELLPGCLEALASLHATHPDLAMVGVHLVGADGKSQPRYACKPLPTRGSLIAEALLPRLRRSGPASPDVTGPALQVAGAAMSVRAEVFARLGGFDERFWPAWFEDVDLARRVHDAGLAVWHCAEARVCHEGGYSRGPLGYAGLLPLYYGNMLRYSQKHFGPGTTLCLRAAIALGMAVRMPLALLSPQSAGAPRAQALSAYRAVLWDALTGAKLRHHAR